MCPRRSPPSLTRALSLSLNSLEEQRYEDRDLRAACPTQHRHPLCLLPAYVSAVPSQHHPSETFSSTANSASLQPARPMAVIYPSSTRTFSTPAFDGARQAGLFLLFVSLTACFAPFKKLAARLTLRGSCPSFKLLRQYAGENVRDVQTRAFTSRCQTKKKAVSTLLEPQSRFGDKPV